MNPCEQNTNQPADSSDTPRWYDKLVSKLNTEARESITVEKPEHNAPRETFPRARRTPAFARKTSNPLLLILIAMTLTLGIPVLVLFVSVLSEILNK